MTMLRALGAAAVLSLTVSACYLWRLLRDMPLSRRLVNLLMPASQIVLVACAYALRPYFAAWNVVALLAALTGMVCAGLNPLFFRSLLAAERADVEAERADLLESQVAAQEHYALLMRRTQGEAERVREELDRELAGVEEALVAGDAESARAHLEGAVGAMRPPAAPYCAHPVVAAILSAKAAWCAESGCGFDADVTVPDSLPTPDAELCALFANALDNAVNACSALDPGAGWIRVRARPTRGYFLLEVENSCARGTGGATDGDGRETRPRGRGLPEHGLGLSIMREIVARHEGSLETQSEGGAFRLSAIWRL